MILRMNKRGQEFLERLSSEILVGDGAFGTQLYDQGFGLDISYERFNLTRPQLVEQVHAAYVAAGADVIETNSFCANFHKQRRFGLQDDVASMARASAEIAKKVARENRYVAGSLGPLTRRRRELDEYSESDMKEMYRIPIGSLIEGGADLILLETFSILSELELALEVALEFDVPVICQMAFSDEGTTEIGVTAERAARHLTEHGAHVLGANCRSGPQVLLEILEKQRGHSGKPFSVYPNAGYAQQVDGRYIYQASPQYFGEQTKLLVEAGAVLVGGCCGTTPDHVRAISEAAQGLKPASRPTITAGPITEPPAPVPRTGGQKFLKVLESTKPFVTVEIEPPKNLDMKKPLEGIRILAQAGCDALNVPDNALAVVRMDNVIFADLLRQNADLPIILHLSCRDKNIIGLQSDLLGAQTVGIEAILAVTGDPASIGNQPGATSVYDINSIGLVEMITSLNQGVTPTGTPLIEPTNFAIGVAINSNVRGDRGMEGAMFKLKKKIKAGAHFVESQPMYDPAIIKNFLDAAKTVEIPVCAGIMPIVSFKNAEFLHNEVPGIKIPKEIRERFKGKDKKEGQKEGLQISKELVDVAIENGATRFYIVPPFYRFGMIAELVEYIKNKKLPN